VTVVSRTIKAINYHHRTGSTKIDFRGTELMPQARGDAKVESQMGSTKIETKLEHMTPASQFGPEYMTYVLWGITPEGRANNLGEVVLRGFSVGFTAGYLRYSVARVESVNRAVLDGPAIGIVTDYNWLLGGTQRFLVGTGLGAKRVLASKAERDEVQLRRAYVTVRFIVGLAF
jgi:hypothetical protein